MVPQERWDEWLAEGDLAGQPWSGRLHAFPLGLKRPKIAAGERVYVAARGRIRGYAPLVELKRNAEGRWLLVRGGGAEAVTVDEAVPAFHGFRYRWWRLEDERPFPDWQALADAGVGRRIREARLKAGLSVSELAKAIGWSVGQLSRVELGSRVVEPVKLAKVARVLGVSVEDLVDETLPAAPGRYRDPEPVKKGAEERQSDTERPGMQAASPEPARPAPAVSFWEQPAELPVGRVVTRNGVSLEWAREPNGWRLRAKRGERAMVVRIAHRAHYADLRRLGDEAERLAVRELSRLAGLA